MQRPLARSLISDPQGQYFQIFTPRTAGERPLLKVPARFPTIPLKFRDEGRLCTIKVEYTTIRSVL